MQLVDKSVLHRSVFCHRAPVCVDLSFLPFSHAHMTEFSDDVIMFMFFFLSQQVNGSDGMYKYEEIILERVSFTLLLVTFPPHNLTPPSCSYIFRHGGRVSPH